MARPTTIDEYLDGFTGEARGMLEELRGVASEAAPDATEAIKWGHPAWVHPLGTILFVVSGHKQHANVVFTPSTREAFDAELADFETGKGRIKLPYGGPVPDELLGRMIAHRVREHEDDGVMWM